MIFDIEKTTSCPMRRRIDHRKNVRYNLTHYRQVGNIDNKWFFIIRFI